MILGKECVFVSKITGAKRIGGVAQVVECLPTKRESLNLNCSPTKNNFKRN
jgi:hypothetical protein